MSPCSEYQLDESLTVLMNLHVRTIVSPYLVPYVIDRHDVCDGSSTAHIDALGNRDFAVGSDGRRLGHWLTIYRDVHHELFEIVPCGEGVWEVREMELRAEWEPWGELIYHDYWVNVGLGNHERIEGGSHGGSGHLIW